MSCAAAVLEEEILEENVSRRVVVEEECEELVDGNGMLRMAFVG
jgi:hypothetical protein